MANPYKTDAEIEKEYKATEADVARTKRAEADSAIKTVQDNASKGRKNAYSAYMMNLKDMPQQMANMGLSGGATETSLLRANTNYENNRNAITTQEQSDINNINTNYQQAMDQYRLQANEDKRKEKADNRRLKAEWDEAQQNKRENRYAKTISGWDSISGIDKEIKRIQKSGKNKWRISYLKARRAELRKEQAKASGGSGGGGRGYSRGSSGGGGGNDGKTQKEKDVEKVKKAIANARNKKGKGNKNKKFSLKNTFRGMYWGAGGKY